MADTPMLIAHRGGSLEAPENTMAAFRHAISLGMRSVELDVQLSRDGELVVIHDETLDRTTDGTGAVIEHTFEELRGLDAGVKFGPQFAGERIPTLREVLDLCVSEGVGVAIELKSPHINVGMEEKVAALLGEMWLRGAENLICISFDHGSVRTLRSFDATIPLGYLYGPDVQEFVQPDDTIQAYCPYFGIAIARPDQVEKAHRLGKLVFVWTVDDAADMRRIAETGVDGIISDRPSLLLEVLGRR